MSDIDDSRRPLTSRNTNWARATATWVARSAITPNQISVASIVFALIGAALLMLWPSTSGLLLAALCVQLRLLCNLLDGMVAIEGGKFSSLGKLYNEVPDRVADSVLIVALGYAANLSWLGWLGALLAALTAYIRLLGGTLGFVQDFRGPMAKQHRMALLTASCLCGAIEATVDSHRWALRIGVSLIVAGSLLTCFTRLRVIARHLRQEA